jgi:hypothetical protein
MVKIKMMFIDFIDLIIYSFGFETYAYQALDDHHLHHCHMQVGYKIPPPILPENNKGFFRCVF